MSGLPTQSTDRRTTTESYYGAVVKHAKGWQPEWAGLKPGEHPRLPKWPPGREQ